MQLDFSSGSVVLRGHLARPAGPSTGTTGNYGLVLCHGFPSDGPSVRTSPQGYPELADRLAEESGWTVLSYDFRGAGRSDGDFSLGGWLADIKVGIDELLHLADVEGVWLAGFGTGGSLALCAAGEDERIQGVATFGSQADFDHWAHDPERFLEHARSIGVVTDKAFPPDFDAWARELRETRPLNLIGKIPPRPVLIVHGSEDERVPLMDARALADAAEGDVELRILSGAGHRLRHDPRAIAVLIGWLDRQHI